MNVEALASHLAWDMVYDHIRSDWWMGYPDPDNKKQMRKAFASSLPRARQIAQVYADILTGSAE